MKIGKFNIADSNLKFFDFGTYFLVSSSEIPIFSRIFGSKSEINIECLEIPISDPILYPINFGIYSKFMIFENKL